MLYEVITPAAPGARFGIPAGSRITSYNVCYTKLLRERAHLQALIRRFRQGATELGLQLGESSTAIQPLLIGESREALRVAEQLRARGIWVTAIRPPTVPAGTARLRLTLTAAHAEQDIDGLLDCLEGCHV